MSADERCAGCGRAVALRANGREGTMLCGSCDARARAVACSVCERVRPGNRRGPAGPICHTCARRHDAAAATAVLRAAIVAVVAEAEPDLDEVVIAAAVVRAAPNLRHTGWLADAVATGPAALLGGSVAPPVVDRLVAELRAAGASRVRPPTCFACGTTRWLTLRIQGLRACTPCAAKAKAEACGRCGRLAPVTTRGADGTAVCSACRNRDPQNFEDCAGCGRPARVAHRTADGRALCGKCGRTRPVVACSACGETRPATSNGRRGPPRCNSCARRKARCSVCGLGERMVAMVFASGPVCSTCHKKALVAKGVCNGCGHRRRIDPRDPDQRGLCSDCAGLEPWSVCRACGTEDRIYDDGRCIACTLDHRLADLVGSSVTLAPLRSSLVATDGPRAALRWLSKSSTVEILGAIARGEVAATHEALDELAPSRALEHLRQVLVVATVLPERNEQAARLEAWIVAQLDAMEVAEDRKVMEAFAHWWVLRRYRWRLAKSGTTSDAHSRRLVRAGVEFLAWLREHALPLETCTQAHVELWLAGAPCRRNAQGFVRWACKRRLAHDLDIVRQRDLIPGRRIDTDQHLALARRFATDESLPLVDRVAGLFLLCYGQPLAKMTRMTTGHVTMSDDDTSVRFGRTDVELPGPVGKLVRELVANPAGRAVTGAPEDTPWLFAGAHPGRPLTPERLRLRLGAYGIDARAARTSLLLDLATELAPGFLADLLGMHPGTAVKWVRAAGGDWSGYAAARARR